MLRVRLVSRRGELWVIKPGVKKHIVRGRDAVPASENQLIAPLGEEWIGTGRGARKSGDSPTRFTDQIFFFGFLPQTERIEETTRLKSEE